MYYGLGDLSFTLNGLSFLLAVLVSWFIPGWVVLSKASLKDVARKALLALPVGLALWGMQGYLLGYLHLRVLTFVYLLLFSLVFFRDQHTDKWQDFRNLWKEVKRQPIWLILLILASALVQVFAHIGSGLRLDQGIAFYFVNSVDGMMHLSYIQELAHRFPPQEPGAVGLPLQNYHYWSDLVVADLSRIWQLPVIHLFFQYAPLLISLWTMLLVVRLIYALGGNNRVAAVALFLFAFGGDASYLLTQVLHGTWGEAVASLDSGATFYFNIPQVYARFVFLGAVLMQLEWWKKQRLSLGVIAILLIASLFGFKVYYALYAVAGFCAVIAGEAILSFLQYLRKNSLLGSVKYTLANHRQTLALVFLLALMSAAIYLPTNSGAGGLRYSYFEWPRRLLSSENIDYADWFLRMQVYEAAGNQRNLVIFSLWAAFLTFIAVYGTRMLGMVPLFRMRDAVWRRIVLLFFPANLLFLLLGLFTLQTSGGLNIFNFLIVPILSFTVFASFSLAKLQTKIFVPVFAIFALLTIPRTLFQLKDFATRYVEQDTDLVITNAQLEAFDYIREHANERDVVQGLITDPQNRLSLYIPFFSQRDAYIAGISMLNSHNQPTKERIEQVQSALDQPHPASRSAALKELGIHYLYLPVDTATSYLDVPAFQNEEVAVYEIR